MPIYEYGCLECGTQFEELVSPSSVEPIFCPKCESPQVDRLLSLFSATQGAPNNDANGHATSPGAALHKPHCGYDWAKSS